VPEGVAPHLGMGRFRGGHRRSAQRARVGPSRHSQHGQRLLEPDHGHPLRRSRAPSRGVDRPPRRAGRAHGVPHRTLAQGQVRGARSVQRWRNLVGANNQPFAPDKFENLFARMRAYVRGQDLYVQDCFACADPRYRLPIRIVTEYAWHSLFARNVFLQASPEELRAHVPAFNGHRRAALPRRSRHRRHALRSVHRGELRPPARTDRRHGLRRRDQEINRYDHK